MAEARNPVGYEKDKLYTAINTASQRVATHADMMQNASGNPMLFVVDVDEETGLQDALYYWSGIEASLLNEATPISVESLDSVSFPRRRGFIVATNEDPQIFGTSTVLYYNDGFITDKNSLIMVSTVKRGQMLAS